MPIKQSLLLEKSASYKEQLNENLRKFAEMGTTKKAFLCHSHQDADMVKGLIVLLLEYGIELYVDWKDQTMPPSPNKITAQKNQDKIKSCNLFLYLATHNSSNSRWCPWEIGYADSNARKIYIIPTENYNGTYGNEYLDLYSLIDLSLSNTKIGLAKFGIGGTNGEWLSSENI